MNKNGVRFIITKQNSKIDDNDIVKMIDYDSKIVIKKSFSNCNNLSNYKKISKNLYLDKKTNIVRQYNKNLYKSDIAIKNSMKRLKDLIDMNFCKDNTELFITLTTKENISELDIIKRYVLNFIRRLKHKYLDSDFIYIYKFEKNKELEKWHCHILLKDSNHKVTYISNNELFDIWKNGYVNVQRVNSKKGVENTKKDNIKDYMCKSNQMYNIPIKAIIWGTSRNIKRPKIQKKKYSEAKNEIKENFYLAYEKNLLVQELQQMKIVNKHKQEIYYKKSNKKK